MSRLYTKPANELPAENEVGPEIIVSDHPSSDDTSSAPDTAYGIKPSDDQILAELESILNSAALNSPAPAGLGQTEAEMEEVRSQVKKIYEPIEATPFDVARQEVDRCQERLDSLPTDDPEKRVAIDDLIKAKQALQVEIDRDQDEGVRTRRRINDWRANEGREDYNASRRKVRTKANTAHAVLAEMTADERAQHRRDQVADNVWKLKAKVKGMSEAEIATGLEKLHAKRAKKRG